MPALAALVLLASSTIRAEDLLTPGTMICTCTPAATAPAVSVAEEAPPPSWSSGRWGIYAGATSLALFGGSFAAHVRSSDLAPPTDSRNWSTASTAMLVGGSVLAGFSAAFLVLRF